MTKHSSSFLARVGYKNTAKKHKNQIPSYKVDRKGYEEKPISEAIKPVIYSSRYKPEKVEHTIMPAYNKGAYQVISKRDVKEVAKKL